MSKILVPAEQMGDWYEELSVVSSYSEGEYEEKIKQYSKAIFSEYYTIRFKQEVVKDGRKKKPDLALIALDYSSWWVVEVELSGHSVDHVIEQVEVFAEGKYNATTLLKYIKRVFSQELPEVTVDEVKLESLVENVPPKIMVVVDEPTQSWKSALGEKKAILCDMQVFKNTASAEVYKLGGEYPSIFVSSFHLKFHSSARNTLEVVNAGSLRTPLVDDAELVLTYNGKSGKWKVSKVNEIVYIKCLGITCPIHSGNNYVLKQDSLGRLTIINS